MAFLALMAVGSSQVFGIGAGYFCGCTGQVTAKTHCAPEACHPVESDGCGGCVPQDSGSSDEVPADDDDHRHQEVREGLTVGGSPPVAAAPAAVLYVLPPAQQLPDVVLRGGNPSADGGLDPPDPLCTPQPVLMARTVVMLI